MTGFTRNLPAPNYRAIIILIAGALFAPALRAAEGDIAAGYQVALEQCAACHIVTGNQVLPETWGVPSFFEIAESPAATVMSLKVFLRTDHDRMPNLVLPSASVDDVVSYILSLRGKALPETKAPKPAPAPPRKPLQLEKTAAER
jgi:mono/diheme cytochrome c family protein